MPHIAGSHHATLAVAGAQEDVDFHVETLGMRFIKKTVLYDGHLPIYHLYYSNAHGDASSVVTTFPFAQAGIHGRRGTNQARELHLAVPSTSLDYWSERLTSRGIAVQDAEVLDRRRLLLTHPCGIEYALVGVDDDPRESFNAFVNVTALGLAVVAVSVAAIGIAGRADLVIVAVYALASFVQLAAASYLNSMRRYGWIALSRVIVNGAFLAGLVLALACSACATSSLPVPDSPVTSTVTDDCDRRPIALKTSCIAGA